MNRSFIEVIQNYNLNWEEHLTSIFMKVVIQIMNQLYQRAASLFHKELVPNQHEDYIITKQFDMEACMKAGPEWFNRAEERSSDSINANKLLEVVISYM